MTERGPRSTGRSYSTVFYAGPHVRSGVLAWTANEYMLCNGAHRIWAVTHRLIAPVPYCISRLEADIEMGI